MDYYVISEKKAEKLHNDKRIALVAHVNYPALIDYCFSYLSDLPPYIDLFITTKGKDNISIIKEKIKLLKNNVKIVVPQDRGREMSALLVACRSELVQYEYIGFVHDKKENAGERYRTVGQSFCDLLWENSVKNSNYIENIIEVFEKDRTLGLLTPPLPYAYHFFGVVLAGWLSNLDITRAVGKMLGLSVLPEEGKYPEVLGMTFWCRRDALSPLFDREWIYEDFDPEPMGTDATISHGIERILSFVVKDQGYRCGIMMTNEYASLYECNYRYMYQMMLQSIGSTADDLCNWGEDYQFTKIRLTSFCSKYNKVYIYGAGVKGRECYRLIKDCGNIAGFLVSDGHAIESSSVTLPIYSIFNVEKSDDTGIIVALSLNNMMEVMPNLRAAGFSELERYM